MENKEASINNVVAMAAVAEDMTTAVAVAGLKRKDTKRDQ
jgi:hypothetical protein